MARGYTRLRLSRGGAGASEVWSALLAAHDRTDPGPWDVGVVHRVFDRSAYLAFDPAALEGSDRFGPPLVLLGGAGFDGPLATRIEGAGPGGFRPHGLEVGDACRLRSRVGGEGRRYALAVGPTMDLEVDPEALVTPTPAPGPFPDVTALRAGSQAHGRAVAATQFLDGDTVEDGLGWLEAVRRYPSGGSLPADLETLVDGWVSVLRADGSTPDPPTDLLGRGPGATPAGDDVLSGLLLALARTTTGDRHRRVSEAGEVLVRAATGRTTTVSAALLAQAALGRANDRVDAAVRAILGAGDRPPDWRSAVRSAAAVGHTSGVDLLLGVLLVPVAIGPALARSA